MKGKRIKKRNTRIIVNFMFQAMGLNVRMRMKMRGKPILVYTNVMGRKSMPSSKLVLGFFY